MTVVLLSEFLYILYLYNSRVNLIMKFNIWYSVICLGTHRQENPGVIATVSLLNIDNRKLYMGTPTILLELALGDSERSKSRTIRG